MIHFCFDRLSSENLGYPNLAQADLAPDAFDHTYPRSIPFRLPTYFDHYSVKHQCHTVDTAPSGSWYPVGLGWHDFDCDYFALIPRLDLVRSARIRVLFYYHEGDNPERIKQRLDSLCVQHQLPSNCYLFVSANTAAKELGNFIYFPEHEFFFRYLNRRQAPTPITAQPRTYDFTALNRVHKWWRASVMSDLNHSGLLHNSLWSYNTECLIDDQEQDNPIQVDTMPGWRARIHQFLADGPYVCDTADSTAHNDHRGVNTYLYQDSYCNLSIETLFDVDQSGGAFITEKTYKCFKFAQPFVLIGPHGSLQALRDVGYRVFDNIIDNSYDTIQDNTRRWFAVKKAIVKIKEMGMHEFYQQCIPDLKHNQQWFERDSHVHMTSLLQTLSNPN